jgi:hypothetical protein
MWRADVLFQWWMTGNLLSRNQFLNPMWVIKTLGSEENWLLVCENWLGRTYKRNGLIGPINKFPQTGSSWAQRPEHVSVEVNESCFYPSERMKGSLGNNFHFHTRLFLVCLDINLLTIVSHLLPRILSLKNRILGDGTIMSMRFIMSRAKLISQSLIKEIPRLGNNLLHWKKWKR